MLGNWIKQTTTTATNGDLTLAVVTGFPPFSSQFAIGEYFYYGVLNDADGTPIESGIGHLSSSTVMVRDKPLATYVSGTYNDNDPAAATLPAGTKRVICSAEQNNSSPNPLNIGAVTSGIRALFPTGWPIPGGAGISGAVTANLSYYVPILIKTPLTVNNLQFRVTGSVVAGSTAKVGLYLPTLTGRPGSLIEQSASIDTATTGMKSGALTKRRLKPGLYFMNVCCSGASTVYMGASSIIDPVLGADPNGILCVGSYNESLTAGWTNLPTTASVGSSYQPPDSTPLILLGLA